MSSRTRVAILFGGQSAEHEISILSARNVLAAIDSSRFEPVLIGIDHAGEWFYQDPERLLGSARDPRLVRIEPGPPASPADLRGPTGNADGTRPIDVVFPVLHGTLGEDGSIQGLLEIAGIAYVGAAVLGSAIGMDKDVSKRLLVQAGIAVARFATLRRTRFERDPARACAELAPLGLPLFIKPANAGSSVGVRKVSRAAELEAAVRYAFEFDSKVIVETAVEGREIEIAVLGGEPPCVSLAGEIVVCHPDGFYSYDAKYIDESGAHLELPAHLTPEALARAQQLAAQTFETLECEGMARVDLFLKDDGTLLVNEINTIPGFTAISMYPKLWALSGLSVTELTSRLIDLALERARRHAKLRRTRDPGACNAPR